MRKIPLTQGKEAIVDEEDYEFLSQFKWHYKNGYAARCISVDGKQVRIWMHRVLTGVPDNLEVDHLDRNGLNNTKQNLRICSRKINSDNRGLFVNNTSGYKGVSWHAGKWQASYRHNGKLHYIGRYTSKEEAYQKYLETKEKLNADVSRIS